MFRAANNPYDDAVVKATDENLTSENWALILDVCDRVTSAPAGPASVIASVIKRLAHRNANVQLYTLELANALSQNCGAPLHRELASRSFTDALLRLANDRNTHQMVKAKVMERMGEWSDMFKGEADLGIMEQAFEKLRAGNPGLAPPGKPQKQGMSSEDKKKEDEELQMALALSLRDKATEAPSAGATPTVGTDAALGAAQGAQQQAGTTAATVSRVKALYDFTPSEPGELAFRMGDIIAVLESVYKDWWKGSLRGQTGIFPLNYVEKLQDPTTEELERDAAMEGEVFSQIRNVEKLLSLLSVRQDGHGGRGDQAGEDEITELYNQTLAIRPKLIELIGKYSQKKDDFTQLNEKFIKARRDYEALLESSMSSQSYALPSRQRQPSQPYYANAYGPPQGYAPQQQPTPQAYQSQAPPPQESRYPYQSTEQQQQQQHGYYPPNKPAATQASAPFHFIPNGAPPSQHEQDRHTPKPLPPQSMGPPGPASQQQQQQQPQGSYSPPISHAQHFPSATGGMPGDRPGSIHTLNSGNPQELGAYDSPVESRHPHAQYPSGHTLRQGQSFDSPASSSVYSPQLSAPQGDVSYAPYAQQQQPHYDAQQVPQNPQLPQQPSQAPPPIPSSQAQSQGLAQGQHGGNGSGSVLPPAGTYPALGGVAGTAGSGSGYQAYNPRQQHAGSGAGEHGGDDASDFYR